MAAAVLIAFSGTQNSGAGESATVLPTDVKTVVAAPEHCPGVRKALRFYTKRWQYWTLLRTGADSLLSPRPRAEGIISEAKVCPRYLLHIRKAKALAAHREWNRFFTYHYAWSRWLPSNWRALAMCETHMNWEHSNSSFTSAFGISWAVYNSDAAYMGAPPWHVRHTPRDQYKAALGHLRRFGDGWGCPGP